MSNPSLVKLVHTRDILPMVSLESHEAVKNTSWYLLYL